MGDVNTYACESDFLLLQGDVLDALQTIPDGVVHMCVTSPPYWGLRDYGTGTWDGGDPSCDHLMVNDQRGPGVKQVESKGSTKLGFFDVCGKCGAKRVDDQLGLEKTPDEYVTAMVRVFREVRRVLRDDGTFWLNIGDSYAPARKGHGIPAKNLVGVPWRIALALQEDGWILRSEVIWHKPHLMPESVTDRPSKCHEHVFMLVKSTEYYFDQEAVRDPYVSDGNIKRLELEGGLDEWPNSGRNIRDVWTINPKPFRGAHFACFPEELVEKCIFATSSERGCCPECGKPWVRDVERKSIREKSNIVLLTRTTGWHAGCTHNLEPTPAVILDPFMGSGTTALVARKHGRRSIGTELNPEYCAMTVKRVSTVEPTRETTTPVFPQFRAPPRGST